ncbi:RNA polymerase sigma-70 factor [Arcticibacter svalbardensis]|nr:RNA polymerase sigma-70 factor [Arcticibacter svalbardensis]
MPEEKSKILLLFMEIQYGNKVAFDELFVLYYDRLLSFARQYTKQLEVAEEITSELFVKIWIKRNDLEHVNNPEVYLFVSIKNACLNLLRSERRRPTLSAEVMDSQFLEQLSSPINESLEEKELLKLLDKAVNDLPEKRRIIFKLIKEDGLNSKAVAKILGISIRTVENQLYKAIKSLADSLADHLGYHPQKKAIRLKEFSRSIILFFL